MNMLFLSIIVIKSQLMNDNYEKTEGSRLHS